MGSRSVVDAFVVVLRGGPLGGGTYSCRAVAVLGEAPWVGLGDNGRYLQL